jgi:hypothetical protein
MGIHAGFRHNDYIKEDTSNMSIPNSEAMQTRNGPKNHAVQPSQERRPYLTGLAESPTAGDFLRETRLLDFTDPAISDLVNHWNWQSLDEYSRIGRAYDFVKDQVLFGYNERDDIPASQVMTDGYGQCNTKGTLFMAFLRSMGIPCRIHGFLIHKRLQKGAVDGILYMLAPEHLLHTWVEVLYNGSWLNLEGVILDAQYLQGVQERFSSCQGGFCGYAVATDDLHSPSVAWNGTDTYIQRTEIVKDLGVFDSPDDFYAEHGVNLSGIKGLVYKHVFRKLMNRSVRQVRSGRNFGAKREAS